MGKRPIIIKNGRRCFMKKTVAFVLVLTLCFALMTSCSLLEYHNVTFVLGGDYENEVVSVPPLSTVTPPTPPKREGYTFHGWYSDYKCTKPADLDRVVVENGVIYAGWVAYGSSEVVNDGVDLTPYSAKDIANTVAVKSLRSSVILRKRTAYQSTLSSGGVVVARSGAYAYVVCGMKTAFEGGGYYIIDAYGRERDVTSVISLSSADGMVLLQVSDASEELEPVVMADTLWASDTDVVVVRADDGRINTCHLEKITGYSYDDDGNVICGTYTGINNSYSLGAPIFDKDGALVGLHLSSGDDGEGGTFITSEQIAEFVENAKASKYYGG